MLYAPHPPHVPPHLPQQMPQQMPPHAPQPVPPQPAAPGHTAPPPALPQDLTPNDAVPHAAAPHDAVPHAAAPPAPAATHSPSAADHCDAIHTALINRGAQTIHELAQATGLTHVQVARRLPEMRGRAVVTARTRPGPAGRLCRVWRAVRMPRTQP